MARPRYETARPENDPKTKAGACIELWQCSPPIRERFAKRAYFCMHLSAKPAEPEMMAERKAVI